MDFHQNWIQFDEQLSESNWPRNVWCKVHGASEITDCIMVYCPITTHDDQCLEMPSNGTADFKHFVQMAQAVRSNLQNFMVDKKLSPYPN